ncbi:MAG: hypothetical protein NXI10_13775 [bacterium]|nr:hypothetical protein [bacterium]
MPRHIHIFRTVAPNDDCISQLSEVMSEHPEISRWHLDLEDIDKVLKVETDSLSEASIISLARDSNIVCESLPD